MKIVVGSGSLAKKKYFEDLFKEYDCEFVLAKDFGLEEPIEDGKTSYENALIKAKYYSKMTGYPCISLDSSLLFLDYPEDHEIQVGSHVKSPKGKELGRIEMRDYYQALAHEYGGKLRAHWIDAYALVSDTIEYCRDYKNIGKDEGFYLVDECHSHFDEAQPLDNISKRMNPFVFFYDYEIHENEIVLKEDREVSNYGQFLDEVIKEMTQLLDLKPKQ